MNAKIKLNQEVIGSDNGLYKLVKVTSVKDARRRGYDINSDAISKNAPYHILLKTRVASGAEAWQSVFRMTKDATREDIEYHWIRIVEYNPANER